jgi:ATP-binding cassette subfamily F protein uup
MSIVSLSQVSFKLAENLILDKANCQIEPKERIALVGRNGAGKSTFLKLLQGDFLPDSGEIQKKSGLGIAGLTQDVPCSKQETVYHFLVKSLGLVGEVLVMFRELSQGEAYEQLATCQQQMVDLHAWEYLSRIETMATRLGLSTDSLMSQLSGGMRRRVLLAAALIAEPELLLLDEPTNHLDMAAIEWLESYLRQYPGSVVVVTHDRQFLSQIATRILEIDRGNLQRFDCDYETYLDRREGIRMAEQRKNELFDKRLQEEEAWLRTGVKARRTRNEGRVRQLKAMRQEYRSRREQMGKVKSVALDFSHSGKIVLSAEKISYQIPPTAPDTSPKTLIRDFSMTLMRGDKIGIIGSNGCGKTTLVRLLLEELKPDTGLVRHGTVVNVAYFDQLRQQLEENQTVMANVADGAEFVMVNGHKKHVATYLRDFLFAPERFNQPVSTLSGGERNRLLLAKLLAKPVNFLVMDEPTNDLDIETLELLESLLIDYTGTLLLISHDRTFIDNIVNSVLVFEGEGKIAEFIGGYEDYRAFKKQQPEVAPVVSAKKPTSGAPFRSTVKLTFKEQRELAELPQQIEMLEQGVAALQLEMTGPAFYQRTAGEITEFNQILSEKTARLSQLYTRWELLESRKSS